jgi:hypothetical protein
MQAQRVISFGFIISVAFRRRRTSPKGRYKKGKECVFHACQMTLIADDIQ